MRVDTHQQCSCTIFQLNFDPMMNHTILLTGDHLSFVEFRKKVALEFM